MAWFSLITNFLTNLLGAIAWPGALLLIVYLFRDEIKRAIPDIENFDAGKGLLALKFNRQSAKTIQIFDEARKQERNESSKFYTPEFDDKIASLNAFLLLASKPLEAIQETEDKFHRTVTHLAQELNLDISGKTDVEIAHDLLEPLVVSPRLKEASKILISILQSHSNYHWSESSFYKEELSQAVAYSSSLQIVETVLQAAARSKNITPPLDQEEQEEQVRAKRPLPPGSG